MSSALDGDRVVAIWRAAVDATHDFLSSEDRAAIDAQVRQFLPGMRLWLAVDAGGWPLGFMALDGPHMEALFVDPAYHHQGVGRALVAHASSLHRMLTTDVNEQNPAALAFYEHLGFTRTGRSDADHQGRPYPLIHLRLCGSIAASPSRALDR